jgi:hypothetical protein
MHPLSVPACRGLGAVALTQKHLYPKALCGCERWFAREQPEFSDVRGAAVLVGNGHQDTDVRLANGMAEGVGPSQQQGTIGVPRSSHGVQSRGGVRGGPRCSPWADSEREGELSVVSPEVIQVWPSGLRRSRWQCRRE